MHPCPRVPLRLRHFLFNAHDGLLLSGAIIATYGALCHAPSDVWFNAILVSGVVWFALSVTMLAFANRNDEQLDVIREEVQRKTREIDAVESLIAAIDKHIPNPQESQ